MASKFRKGQAVLIVRKKGDKTEVIEGTYENRTVSKDYHHVRVKTANGVDMVVQVHRNDLTTAA